MSRTRQADVRDLDAADLEGYQAVVHMAELSNDPLGALDPALTERINLEGSSRLARIAKQAGVEVFVYMSSCSVYGAADGVVEEDSPLRPQTDYARCKAKVEDVLHGLASPDFSPVILRNATAFGASPRLRLDLVVNDLCAQAYCEGRLTLSSDGRPWRPLVHGLDIAGAIAAVLDSPRHAIADAVLNVGHEDNNLQVRQIAELVSEEFGGLDVTLGTSGGDARSYAVDFARIRAVLPQFHCEWSVRAGVGELRDSFGANQLAVSDVARGTFSRVATLSDLRANARVDHDLRWTDRPLVAAAVASTNSTKSGT